VSAWRPLPEENYQKVKKMMKFRNLLILLVFTLLFGCQTPAPPETPEDPTTTPTRALAGVTPQVTPAPDPKSAARAYLDAWGEENYPVMYALLTSISRAAISEEEFSDHYQSVAIEAAVIGVEYEVTQSLIDSDRAMVGYRVILHSSLFGDITGETTMNLSLEEGSWRVQWADTLILRDLAGGNYLKRSINIPARANIYDRSGNPIAAMTDATAIGLIPSQIEEDYESSLYNALSNLTGIRAENIRAKVDLARLFGNNYVQLGEVPTERVNRSYANLTQYSGLVMRNDRWRFYYDGGLAPHLIGYVGPIQAEEAAEYQKRGYNIDERVGRDGLEYWGEQYLGGQRGGALWIFNAQGQVVRELVNVPVQPGQAIHTTIDRDLQLNIQRSMQDFRGAVVVVERDTGRVLAMVSSPTFDANAYQPENYNFSSILNEIYSDQNRPWANRAAQEHYPLGSVFKIVTMAAALESGDYNPESRYECGYFFDDLGGGIRLYDWTYERFLENGTTQPSGNLSLSQGLMRSCNIWFYHIGLDFFERGKGNLIADMARGFGLGTPTGLKVLDEASGNVPDPAEKLDATNLAIGQGNFLATPLQVANFVAAVGNGGTLYTPQVIEKIVPPFGDPTFVFSPQVLGELPVSPENLRAIQQAMIGVVESTNPVGTAQRVFVGLNVKVAGKTGTAQTGFTRPHAWFAGYTYENRADKPDIAVAVILENVGEGSEYAAPLMRRVIELYFRGAPARLLPWESTYYVLRSPTPTAGPEETEGPTSTPAPTETPAPADTPEPTEEPGEDAPTPTP
jgi:penicillin-binding protein 2